MRDCPCKNIVFLISVCLIVSIANVCSGAQESDAWRFPTKLRPALDARLKVFLDAQAEGRWNDVADMLGDYRRGYFSGYLKFTPSHKRCLIREMQKSPLVSFDYTIRESPFSSEILTTPTDRRWWTLVGEGTFGEGTNSTKHNTWLVAYLDRGDWFFTPGISDGADAIREPKKEVRDSQGDVDLLTSPDSPLDVVELHVDEDPKNPAARDIRFRLHNKTDSTVTRYGYKISDEREDGSISYGTGAAQDAIGPNAISREFHENYVLYQYWCEGEPRVRIAITDAALSEGKEWSATSHREPQH